jgi:hypothetical protein
MRSQPNKFSPFPQTTLQHLIRSSLITLLIVTLIPTPLKALSPEKLDFFAETGIMFYDPDATGYICPPTNTPGSIAAAPTSGSYSAMREAIRTYGEHAMNLQREYGSPWELIFAQMQKESSTGTASSPDAVNVQAKQAGGYNWLGIRSGGSGGDLGVTANGSWSVYSSVESMMEAWAGTKVLRSGYYDAAFQYTDPNNYSIDAFIETIVPIYAPASDGNNPTSYISQVKGFLSIVAEVRAEKGWPSSAELASNESIPIGGNHPLGTSIDTTTSTTISSQANCPSVTPGTIVPGGFTTEAAAIDFLRTAMEIVDADINNEYVPNEGQSHDYCNCVSLSKYFLQTYTTLGPSIDLPSGGEVVDSLKSTGVAVDNTPQPYSIFSINPNTGGTGPVTTRGHTGVILGITGDTALVGEWGNCSWLTSATYHGVGLHTYTLDELTSSLTGPSPIQFAHPTLTADLTNGL